MQSIDYTKTFCIVEALGKAEDAFKFKHNSKYLVESTELPRKRLRTTRQTTPSFQYKRKYVLALTLDADFDHRRGVIWGSDEEKSDIQIDIDNKSGISAVHFRLCWNWRAPLSNCLLIFNCSSNGTVVDNHFLDCEENPSRMLAVSGPTIVEAGHIQLKFEIPSYRPAEQQTAFLNRWQEFVKQIHESPPTLDRFTLKGRFQPTPPFSGSKRSFSQIATKDPNHELGSVVEDTEEEMEPEYEPPGTKLKSVKPAPSQRCEQQRECRVGLVRNSDIKASNANDEEVNTHIDNQPRHYTVLECIGTGVSAKVYIVADTASGARYAVKKVDKRKPKMPWQKLYREVEILERLQHPHLVKYFGSRDNPDYFEIFMEYVLFGNLQQYTEDHGGMLAEDTVKSVGSQIVDSLVFMHRLHYVHRDLKPENILIYKEHPLHVKVSDFGLSRTLDPQESPSFSYHDLTFCGTLAYCAPEVFPQAKELAGSKPVTYQRYSYPIDIWSLGATLWELVAGEPPFQLPSIQSALQTLHSPLEVARLKSLGISQNAVELLTEMLQVDPSRRPTAEQCQRHKFFEYCSISSASTPPESPTDDPKRRHVERPNFERTSDSQTARQPHDDHVVIEDSLGNAWMTVQGKYVCIFMPDRWLNATQIIALAGKDSTQRKQILDIMKMNTEVQAKKKNSWVPFQDGWLLCKHLQLTDKLRSLWEYGRKKGFDLGSHRTNYFDPGYLIIKDGAVSVTIRSADFWVNATDVFKTASKYRSKLELFRESNPGKYDIVTGGVFQGTYVTVQTGRRILDEHGLHRIRSFFEEHLRQHGWQRENRPQSVAATEASNLDNVISSNTGHFQPEEPKCKTIFNADLDDLQPSHSAKGELSRTRSTSVAQVSCRTDAESDPCVKVAAMSTHISYISEHTNKSFLPRLQDSFLRVETNIQPPATEYPVDESNSPVEYHISDTDSLCSSQMDSPDIPDMEERLLLSGT